MYDLVMEERGVVESCKRRGWDELMPDTLGLIFQKLPLQDILSVVPIVCKAWAGVVRGPYCWRQINIEESSRHCHPDALHRTLQMLVSRSCGSLRSLHFYGLSTNNTLFLIADNAKNLEDLQLPRSDISSSILEEVAWKLSNVSFLDLSYCTKIGPEALRALGKHCKHLTTLLRNMHPWDVIDRRSQDDEALTIATTMPNLRHLELAYLLLSTEVVVKLITCLDGLELLDIRGCWNVKLDADMLDRLPRLSVVGPLVSDSFERDGKLDGIKGYSLWSFGRSSYNMEYIGEVYEGVDDEDEDDGDDMELLFYE